jgi:hypothetical protein
MTSSTPLDETVSLGDLINGIRRSSNNELDQLSSAVVVAQHLDEVGDHLIGHFVDQARRAGASWSDIGQSMGVTKQAVQKRFVSKTESGAGDFSRFTPRARNAIIAATNEAHSNHNAAITPAHLLLGLLADPDALAGQVLDAQGHPAETIRAAARAATPPPTSEPLPSLIPYDAQSVKVLELTAREALRLGHNYIGTEHLLLALLETEDESGVLTQLGIQKDQVAADIQAALAEVRRNRS